MQREQRQNEVLEPAARTQAVRGEPSSSFTRPKPSAQSPLFQPEDAIDLGRVRRALVVKLRHHGDVLLTTPVLTALKRNHPAMEIDGLVYAETETMLARHPALARLFMIDRGWRGLGALSQLREEWRLLRALRARRYDLLVCLTEQWRCAFLARVLRPRYAVVGEYAKRRSAFWRRSFSHHYAVPAFRDKIESHLDALRRIGCSIVREDKQTTLPRSPEAEARATAILAEHGLQPQGFVLVHPTSRWLYKCWRPERYAEVIDRLAALGMPIIVTAAPRAEERAFVAAILEKTEAPVVDLTGQLALPDLGALIRQAACFVGVDSVPMHLAAAAGTPLVALFGPSSQAIWAPKVEGASILSSKIRPCMPCFKHGCGNSGYSECLADIGVEETVAAVRGIARFHSRR